MKQLLELSDDELKDRLCPSPITPNAWTFTGQELREAIQGDRLLNVSIDLSKKCNLNCPYCYTASINSSKREKGKEILSFEDYKEIVLQLKEAGTKTINIIGEGEPTLYPFFFQFVDFIAQHGMKVLLATNGILLASQEKLVDLLNEVEATIVLKVNSLDNHLQDLLVGRNGYARIRNKALNKLIEKGFNSSIPTRLAVDTLLVKAVQSELYDLFLFCRKNNVSFIASVYMPTGRTAGIEFHGQEAIQKGMDTPEDLYVPMDQEEICELLNRIKVYDKEFEISRTPEPAYISGMACTQLLGVQIDNQGKVWCCPARMILDQEGAQVPWFLADNPLALKSLWSDNAFLRSMRSGYTGRCIFKQNYQKY